MAANKRARWIAPLFIQEALSVPEVVGQGDLTKRNFRSRAHCNPLSHNDAFHYPKSPSEVDWSHFYPQVENPVVRFLDVGCGYGGLTVALSSLYPDKCVLALEIRARVYDFVQARITAMRQEETPRGHNAAVLRTNAMKYLPNFLAKGQLEKIFFCFPDPHFKAKNHRRRIISETLLTEYAYFLREGGLLYAITDVEELHEWHVAKLSAHACFERVSDEEMEADPAANATKTETEESKKVDKKGGGKYFCAFRRRPDAAIRAEPWPRFASDADKDDGEGGGGDDDEA